MLTEWAQFVDLDCSAIAEQAFGPMLIDARNLLDPKEIARMGLSYLGNGRPSGF